MASAEGEGRGHEWQVDAGETGARLDHVIAARAGISHAAARRAIAGGTARVNGRRAKKGARVTAGDRVSVEGALHDAESLRPLPQPELPLVILYQDNQVLALDKPTGMPSHPLTPGERGTLANALVARFPECALAGDDPREGGLAHRLDGDTSGVLLAARDPASWRALREAFHEGRARKEYLALVSGVVEREGEVTLALQHAPGNARKVLCVPQDTPDARPAHTRYAPIASGASGASGGGFTLVRATTSTGRMHQVRAHLACAGFPIVGDTLYGGPSAPLSDTQDGHFLHASKLTIPHPNGSLLEITAPLPEARRALLKALGIHLATR